MAEIKVVNNFTSYLKSEEHELRVLDNGDDASGPELKPRLLPGELVVAEAHNVLSFVPVSEQNQGHSGLLVVTNFKVSFITSDHPETERPYQQNLLLGDQDVCLSNISAIYHLGDKKRKLVPGQSIGSKIKGLVIVCKNMRVLRFSFKFSPINQGKVMANAILHHAFPTTHSRLFAYDYKEEYYPHVDTVMFGSASDWRGELTRLGGAHGWRVSLVNQQYHLSATLAPVLVVPSAALDAKLGEAARHFRNGSVPVWVWGTPTGAALVRMSDIHPSIGDRTQENVMLEHVRMSHPQRRQPVVMDMTHNLPTPKDVHASYLSFRDICTPDDISHFWTQDSRLYSLLEHSRWLHHVSSCIQTANEVADLLSKDHTVVIQEGDGRDMNCLISSLVQIILDPHYRTIDGFQSLVQKDWVTMGHPFCDRLGHVCSIEAEQSPLFLLFLDCVWQLGRQFPAALEFSETYLTTLWDAAHISVFETFLFNCQKDRLNTAQLIQRSLWDWGEQYHEKHITLFTNPLFTPFYTTQQNLYPASVSQMFAQNYIRQTATPSVLNRLSSITFNPKSSKTNKDTDSRFVNYDTNIQNPSKSHRIGPPVPPKPTNKARMSTFDSLPAPVVQNVRLCPSHSLVDLDLWAQNYFRFIPTLEIKNGGRIQIDMQNRILVNNINSLYLRKSTGDVENVDSVDNGNDRIDLSTVNSFFPFSQNADVNFVVPMTNCLLEDVMFESQSLMNEPD